MLEFFLENINLTLIIGLIILGYISGTIAEQIHFKSIKMRERELINLSAITSKNIEKEGDILWANLVNGSVVISQDYFKRFLASLKNFFGGELTSYETLLDRGRREAILRMKQQARDWGATMILNMRIETASIGMKAAQKGGMGSIEIYAYGTAVKLRS
jgi:uncharacterized protein YbjQ (UPF0145 family)